MNLTMMVVLIEKEQVWSELNAFVIIIIFWAEEKGASFLSFFLLFGQNVICMCVCVCEQQRPAFPSHKG